MGRLIFVPQYPTPLRYQQWWLDEFEINLKHEFEEIIILKPDKPIHRHSMQASQFSPTKTAIEWEMEQIKKYLELNLKDDDVLLLADLSFPGLFTNVLFYKKPKRCFAICHATSKNNYDYFQPVRKIKYPIEKNTARLFDKIFVGSHYHARKLGWNNIQVTYLPFPPFQGITMEKKYMLSSVGRPGIQKRNTKTERYICNILNTIIHQPENITCWEDYFKFLAQSKILFITSKEETFGYQVMDAILNGCIPIAPNKYSYPELLPPTCLYNNKEEAKEKILHNILQSAVVPQLKVKTECTMFYHTISKTIKL